MIEFVKKHSLFSLYGFIFMFLFYGVWATSGTNYLMCLVLFFSSFVISYFLLARVKLKFPTKGVFLLFQNNLAISVMFFICLVLVFFHVGSLGEIPALKAINSTNGDDISRIRAAISGENNKLFNYISRILVHSLIPFTLLLLAIKKRDILFYILLILSVFYAFSLMQKSFIITILLPILIYSIATKKLLLATFNISSILLVVISLTLISNPALRTEESISEFENKKHLPKMKKVTEKGKEYVSSSYRLFYGLKKRLVIVPGEMISKWFENIPSKLPFLGVNGYRPVALFNRVDHHEYSRILYPVLYPEHHKRGIQGTVNAASFMYEYANFGVKGLVFSGIILSFLFVTIEAIFKSNLILKLALNFYPVLVLSSSALTTLIFSGGWGIMILFYYLFFYSSADDEDLILKKT